MHSLSIAHAHAPVNLCYKNATLAIIWNFDTDEAVVISEGEVDSHPIPAEIVKQETLSESEQGEIHYNQV